MSRIHFMWRAPLPIHLCDAENNLQRKRYDSQKNSDEQHKINPFKMGNRVRGEKKQTQQTTNRKGDWRLEVTKPHSVSLLIVV